MNNYLHNFIYMSDMHSHQPMNQMHHRYGPMHPHQGPPQMQHRGYTPMQHQPQPQPQMHHRPMIHPGNTLISQVS